MESAGRAVAAVLAATIRHPGSPDGVLVAAGPGHNGGDGWVLARALHRLDVPVWVTAPPGDGGAELRERMARLARAEGVREVAPDGPWPTVGLAGGCAARDRRQRAAARAAGRAARTAARPRGSARRGGRADRRGPADRYRPRRRASRSHGDFRRCSSRPSARARRGRATCVVADIGHPPAESGWPALVTDDVAAGVAPPAPAPTITRARAAASSSSVATQG